MNLLLGRQVKQCTYGVKRVGEWHFTNCGPLVGGVESLDSENGSGSGQVLLGGDERGATKI